MRKSILLITLAVLVVAAGSAFYYLRAQSLTQYLTTPLELHQIILPDNHPQFPNDTAWVLVQGSNGPIEVPVPLAIPENWAGIVKSRVEGNVVYFEYIVIPDQKHAVFAVGALTEDKWAEEQAAPVYPGEAIFTYGGIVYIYSHSLDVPYTGSPADEFARLVSESRQVAGSLGYYLTPQP